MHCVSFVPSLIHSYLFHLQTDTTNIPSIILKHFHDMHFMDWCVELGPEQNTNVRQSNKLIPIQLMAPLHHHPPQTLRPSSHRFHIYWIKCVLDLLHGCHSWFPVWTTSSQNQSSSLRLTQFIMMTSRSDGNSQISLATASPGVLPITDHRHADRLDQWPTVIALPSTTLDGC